MRLSLHLAAVADTQAIIERYRRESGAALAEEFFHELDRTIERVTEQSGAFAAREHGRRRANLPRFPYHFLFRVIDRETVRVLVVRHHRQRPSFGTRRV